MIYGEPLDRVTAEVRYRGAGVEVINGVAAVGQSRVLLSGAYSHPINDLKNGELKFNISLRTGQSSRSGMSRRFVRAWPATST